MNLDMPDNYFPKYGQVDEIIVWDDEKFFVVCILEVVNFTDHLMAYEVQRTERTEIWSYADLPWHGVLNIVMRSSKYYVVEKDTAGIELV